MKTCRLLPASKKRYKCTLFAVAAMNRQAISAKSEEVKIGKFLSKLADFCGRTIKKIFSLVLHRYLTSYEKS